MAAKTKTSKPASTATTVTEPAPVVTAAVVVPAPVAPAPVVTPVAPAPAVAHEADDNDDSADEDSNDNAVSKISPARCSLHIKFALSKPVVEEEIRRLTTLIAPLETTLKPATDAVAAATVAYKADKTPANKAAVDAATTRLTALPEYASYESLKSQREREQKKITRVSDGMPIAVAIVVESALREILERGIDAATTNNTKGGTVNVKHLRNGPALPLSPLYANCPVWRDHTDAQEDVLQDEHSRATRAARELNKANKAAGKAPETPTHHKSNSFKSYIKKVIDDIREARKSITSEHTFRMSSRVDIFLSDLTIQMIHSLVRSTEINSRSVAKVRTMQVADFGEALQFIFNHYQMSSITDEVGESSLCCFRSPQVTALQTLIEQKITLHATISEQNRQERQARAATAATTATVTA
jgi:hypothetical protein